MRKKFHVNLKPISDIHSYFHLFKKLFQKMDITKEEFLEDFLELVNMASLQLDLIIIKIIGIAEIIQQKTL